MKGELPTYLLGLLGILLFIILISFILIGLTTGSILGIGETGSKLAWTSAYPFSITEYTFDENSLEITLKNNADSLLTLKSIILNNEEFYSYSTTFEPGEEKTLSSPLDLSCANNLYFDANMEYLEYTDSEVISHTQKGTNPLVYNCG